MPKTLAQIIFLVALIQAVKCIEREMTVNIEPGREDCFYEAIKQGEVIDIDYQVIDGGHGDLDITFRLAEPNGRIVVVDIKKPENNHRLEAALAGDYRFCFDNTFSSYNSKTVFFELVVQGENDEWGSEENIDFNKVDSFTSSEVYEMKIQDIQDIMGKVRNYLSKARHYQEIIKSFEARDRNIGEENYFKVNSFSSIQIIIMVIVGVVQVIMLRSLFDDNSRVHKIWKGLQKR